MLFALFHIQLPKYVSAGSGKKGKVMKIEDEKPEDANVEDAKAEDRKPLTSD